MDNKKLIAMVLGIAAVGTVPQAISSPLVRQKSHFSELWGRSGERWTSQSRLPDFSYAGYHAGEQPIPVAEVAKTSEQTLNVRELGAQGDGTTDDTRAFREAIASCQGGTIFIPPGRYVLSDILSITKSNVVLRGAGQDATTLFLSRSLEDLLGAGNVPYYGGLIDVSGENRGQRLTTITLEAVRGDTTLQVASAHDIRAGQWVRLLMTNPADNSLGSHLYADKGTLNAERRRWFAGHIVDWAVRVRSVRDNTVTLERPLRLDVRPEWQPELWEHSPTVEEVGIENLTIEFPPVEYRGHWKEAGYFAIQFTGVYNSWVRNLTILDADMGVIVGAGGYNTVTNVTLQAKARTGAATNGGTGHYGFVAYSLAQDNLFTRCAIQTTFVHNMSVNAFANGNVYSGLTTKTGRFDHHGATPYENLFASLTDAWRFAGLTELLHRHPDYGECGRLFPVWRKPGGRAQRWGQDDVLEHPLPQQIVPPERSHQMTCFLSSVDAKNKKPDFRRLTSSALRRGRAGKLKPTSGLSPGLERRRSRRTFTRHNWRTSRPIMKYRFARRLALRWAYGSDGRKR